MKLTNSLAISCMTKCDFSLKRHNRRVIDFPSYRNCWSGAAEVKPIAAWLCPPQFLRQSGSPARMDSAVTELKAGGYTLTDTFFIHMTFVYPPPSSNPTIAACC